MTRPLSHRLAPFLFTVGFFILWELGCRLFKVSNFILPAPSVIFAAMQQYAWPLTRNAFHTLWMTMFGFGISIVFGLAIGLLGGSLAAMNAARMLPTEALRHD
jgi:NitT/TauT family transport system permease protein